MSAPDLMPPPIEPGEWRFVRADMHHDFRQEFTAKTWFEARAKACAFFRCEPSEVVCVGRPA